MKKLLFAVTFLFSFAAFAQQLTNLSKDDVKDVSAEFGANFAHTTVSAPETEGMWGIELGVYGGTAKSPNFADVIEESGGDEDDFKSIYHAGILARAHFPFDLFAEISFLPEQEFDDVKIKSQSFELGWNAGAFFGLPLDIALGFNRGTGEINFSQDADVPNAVPAADITFETTTTMYWLGVSKTFLFITPYGKIGAASIEGELDATASILGYSSATSETVDVSGTYLAAGANLQFAFLKLGVEATQIIDVRKLSAKLSFDF
jgi:hypothetical protein